MNHLLQYLISSFRKCIFVGDFNFPDINWSSLIGSSLSSNIFCDFIFNLNQHVIQPTHTKGNTLDLVLTTPSVNIEQVAVNLDHLCNFSDHFVISFDIPSYLPSIPNPKPLHIFGYIY